MEQFTDEQLVELCLQGQQDAFAELVRRYQNQLLALAYRLGGDYDEARDMAQECFIHIYNELPKYDSTRRFFPWMYRVARNVCLNQLAKRPKDAPGSVEAEEMLQNTASTAAEPGALISKAEQKKLIFAAINDLPEQYRLPVLCKYVEGLSYKEISAKLDLPESTIETRLFRGRAMLRDRLKEILGE